MRRRGKTILILAICVSLVAIVYVVGFMSEQQLESFLLYQMLADYCGSHGRMPASYDALVAEGYLRRAGHSAFNVRSPGYPASNPYYPRRKIHPSNFGIAFNVSGSELSELGCDPDDKAKEWPLDISGNPVMLYRDRILWFWQEDVDRSRSRGLAKAMASYWRRNPASHPASRPGSSSTPSAPQS